MKKTLYIGLMSGTSLDGADGVLVDFSDPKQPQILAHAHHPMPKDLREEFFSLNQPASNELHRSAIAANKLIRDVYTPVVKQLLQQTNTQPEQVQAIGAHGQTVRHQPHLADLTAYTLQLNAPALLAELTDITVVSDFRSRDIAAGGQGAPLVCTFHAELFSQPHKTIAILNLGGIANFTLLTEDNHILGFDCGPANALMDEWCELHTGKPYDENGVWAASGQLIPELLQAMLQEPYFSLHPPKSTGRDLFHMEWLNHHLRFLPNRHQPQDIQATLLELTAQSAAQALRKHAPNAASLLLCGGGALNSFLTHRLQELVHPTVTESTAAYGVPPLQVEATAFAWLARKCILEQPANSPQVTGAKGARILGAIYQA
ncbi:MAG: anhydro-N-acetylmuramic acid kinase [Saezia sp.]